MVRHEQLIAGFDADGYPYGPIDMPASAAYPARAAYPEHLDPAHYTADGVPETLYPVTYQIADTVLDSYLSGQVN